MVIVRMFASCATAVKRDTGRTVAESYGNADLFCNDIFVRTNLIGVVRADTEHNCFDPSTRDCTADDIDFHYTDCVNGNRDLTYSWKANTTCMGGVSLPAEVLGLNCRPSPLPCWIFLDSLSRELP